MIPAAFASTLRFSLRRVARSPRLSIGAVLCIAVGTAATSAAFTLVSATLLRPLPYPEADRLARIWLDEPGSESRIPLSYPDLRDLTESLSAPGSGVEALEATARARILFHSEEGTRRVEGEAVTPGYFRLLGVEPLVGRLFSREEHQLGASRVMLLTHRTWGERFAFDEHVVGRTIRTGEGPYTVIGVLPPSFSGTVESDSGELEFWVPIEQYLSAERRERRDLRGIWTIARLAPGATVESVGHAVEALGQRLAALFPDSHGGRTFAVEPLGENWRSGVRQGSLLLLGASGLLLLVAAANVATLVLARAIDDRRELAIRTALGAGRRWILGQALTDTVLVVAAGSLLGLGLGPALMRVVVARAAVGEDSPLGIPVFVHLHLDPVAVGFCCLAFFLTALVAGLGPVLLGSRIDPGRVLREGSRAVSGSRRVRRWSNALILTEVALTTVLVVGAALLLRSYHAMATEDLGFRTRDVLRIALFVNQEDVGETAALVPFYERVRGELAAQPGVKRVGVVWPTVPMDWPVQEVLAAPGLEPTQPEVAEAGVRVGVFVADPAFFDVLEIPLLAGRGFRSIDQPDAARVGLVSRSLARRLAGQSRAPEPGSRAALERVVGTEAVLRGEPVRIVGVVGDTRFGGPRESDSPASRYELYLPFSQSPQRLMSLTIATGAPPESLVGPLSRRLAKLAPASALDWAGPLDRWVADLYLLDTRFLLSVVGLFCLAGLFLSALGLFAVLADSVARRGPEIGVRQALGATPGRILATVVGEGLRLVVAGLVLGSLLVWWGDRLLESFVYEVTPNDPWTYAATVVILLSTALLASFLPARRAAAVDPAAVLREE